LPSAPTITFTKDAIFDLLVPPLIFEAAFYLRWKQLRREFPVILTLASAGVVVSGAITVMGMHYWAQWPWPSALVFSALIAAMDPIAAIFTFRESGGHGRLHLLIEAESLFDDGSAAVAFGAAILIAIGRPLTAISLTTSLLATVGGAVLCGIVVGGMVLFLTRHPPDHLDGLISTSVAAYGSFLLAEHFNFSGVFATMTAGLLIGNWGPLGTLSDHGREVVHAFWEYAGFVASSFVFLLIGMDLATQNFTAVWLPIVVAVIFVVFGRAVAVYSTCVIFARSDLRVSRRHQNALLWGAQRGALPLALALGLPAELPWRAEIIAVSFAVVAFSVFVQGLTTPSVLRAIGELPPRHHMMRFERHPAR
jgi:CPA1 family monovalent cation:H+ antiporter